MEETGNKTIICSVLFLDIVEYSKKSVSGQIALKEAFNAFLSSAIQFVALEDRIILDTGDGAAISFLGDIGDALKVALAMRTALLGATLSLNPPLLVCMGINLGPVRLVKDINGLPNIVGDGINVAQRIMGFADPGQILASRAYYDAVSRLSQEHAGMFHYGGLRTDKHVREHEIYAIGYAGDLVAPQHVQPLIAQPSGTLNYLWAWTQQQGRRAFQRLDAGIDFAQMVFRRATLVQRALYIGALAIPVVLIIAVAGKSNPPNTLAIQVAVPAQQVSAVSASAQANVSDIVATTTVAALPSTALIKSRRSTAEKSYNKNARTRTLEETLALNPAEAALVSLAITPWGEIYLDGRMQGVSPPLAELQVTPGEHEIEIRNSNFPRYYQKFTIKSNGKIKIKHKF
ncbi:MAG: adenylate/guanylate cyclase domain-containing protein [Gallionellaceae bacterium]|nr:adenylate/guanylate cyclase domain-containing protein [Gallionellaceae bacterium]